MINIHQFDGRRRVVLDRLLPSVEAGRYPLKRVIGDAIRFEAHAIADGHDIISLVLRHRLAGSTVWHEQPMSDSGNDTYHATIQPQAIGLYEYGVAAWCDPFVNWHHGFVKKAQSGDPKIGVELQIGGHLLAATAARASGEDADCIRGWAEFIGDPDRDLAQRLQLALSHTFYQRVTAWPDRSLATETEQPYLLLIERERAVCGAWYEFFPRSATNDGWRHGTFADAARLLPDIAAMGFDIIYLPPIHPIGRLFRKGRNNALVADEGDCGSPWAIGSAEGGHKAIHPELGTLADFHAFRDACHALGMELALDIAFQCAPDHPYVTQHPQWFRWRPDGSVQYAENPPKKYQDILPFDFETDDWQNLWLELKSVFDYWIEQGVKVFRVDNPHTKPMEFWRWCILEIKKTHPDVIFLAEAFTRPKRKYRLAKGGFTQGYTYFTWRNNAQDMRDYVIELTKTAVADYFYPNFWPNTPDILHEDLQHGTRATYVGRLVLAATLSANYGMYGPAYELMDSEPFPGKEEYNNNEKYQLKIWDRNKPGHLRPEIARINRLRREHPALQRTANVTFVDSTNPHLLAYLKQNWDRSSQLLIVVNMDWQWEQSGFIYLPLTAMNLTADREFGVRDLFDPQLPVYRWRGSENYIRLDPRQRVVHVFEIVR
jgi:starch synthase (maltosyl-transferring)